MAAILVTAGPTREYLDEVRYLSNASTGQMGYAIAAAAQRAGHSVMLVSGPTALPPPAGVELSAVVSAQEMCARAEQLWVDADIGFGVAAVADYRPRQRVAGKPPKAGEHTTLELTRNPDVVAALAADKGARVVVGFALESAAVGGLDAALERARAKRTRKGCDLLVFNETPAVGAATSQVHVIGASDEQILPLQSKAETAAVLVQRAVGLWQQRQEDQA